MAEQPQTIVQAVPPEEKPLGSRSQNNLSSIYAASPIYLGELTDDERKSYFQDNILDGQISKGLGFANFNTSYTINGAPDLEQVETGGSGLPATPFVPNPASPGPGSLNASDIPEFTGEIAEGSPEFGSGLGGTLSPLISSTEIEKQTLGEYINGKSYAGSNGSQ
jgi:hypothetical protein